MINSSTFENVIRKSMRDLTVYLESYEGLFGYYVTSPHPVTNFMRKSEKLNMNRNKTLTIYLPKLRIIGITPNID